MAMKFLFWVEGGGHGNFYFGRNALPPFSGCKWLLLTCQNIWYYNTKDCDMKILSFFQHIRLTGYEVILKNQKIIPCIASGVFFSSSMNVFSMHTFMLHMSLI
jgi:hypothetical protein